MTLDTSTIGIYTYFLIILSGFGFVWGYRRFSGNKHISDFEYAGFSAFWGVIILGIYHDILIKAGKLDDLIKLISNPFIAGAVLFIFGVVLGLGLKFLFGLLKSLFR